MDETCSLGSIAVNVWVGWQENGEGKGNNWREICVVNKTDWVIGMEKEE